MTLFSLAARRLNPKPAGSDSADEAGFTLIEVVVAFTILMITSLGLVAAMVTGARATTNNQQRTTANNIAKRYIEAARAPGALATPITTPTIVASGANYSVCRLVAPVPAVAAMPSAAPATSLTTCSSSPGVTCSSSVAGLQYYVSVLVTWSTNPAGLSGSSILGRVRSDTVIAC